MPHDTARPRRVVALIASAAIAGSGVAAIAGPASAADSTPTSCEGVLRVNRADGGLLGYVGAENNGSGHYVLRDRSAAARLSFVTGEQLNLVDPAAPPSTPNIGLVQWVGDGNLGQGSYAANLFQATATTAPGDGSASYAQSAVWSVDVATGKAVPTWVNAGGSTASETRTYSDHFLVTGDPALFDSTFGGSEAVTFTAECDKTSQTVSFTSTAPTKGYVDGTYDVVANGGASGNEVTYGAGPSDVCTIEGSRVTFTGAGTCTVTADQAGNDAYRAAPRATQTIPVSAKTAQTITFSTTAPEAPYVGSTYPVAASSDSGLPVTLGSATPEVCTVSDGTVSVVAAGDCTITADQAGDGQTAKAEQVVQGTTAQKVTPAVTLDVPTGAVTGQSVRLSATVSVPEDAPAGTPAGTVRFFQEGALVGEPVAVGAGGVATSDGFGKRAGEYPVSAAFTPADAVTYTGAEQSSRLNVTKAETTTTLGVQPTRLRAVVAVTAPGASEVEGSVEFRVGEQIVGRADVTPVYTGDGLDPAGDSVSYVATLDHTVPAGQAQQVSATYSGSDDLSSSGTSVTRNDPTISATVSSESAKSESGWYRSPVTVHYSCTPVGSDLTESCPADDIVTADGTSTLEHTIHAEDGGVATISTTVAVDRTAPVVTLPGIRNGQLFFVNAPAVKPVSTDATSGVASTVTTVARNANGNDIVKVVATDNAGNVTRLVAAYRVVDFAVDAATYTDGRWNVPRGKAFTVRAKVPGTPLYAAATTVPGDLRVARTYAMTRTGAALWKYTAVSPVSASKRNYWVGVRQGQKITAIPIRTVG